MVHVNEYVNTESTDIVALQINQKPTYLVLQLGMIPFSGLQLLI